MQESSRTRTKEGQISAGQVRLVASLWLLLMALSLQAFAQNVATGRLFRKTVGAENGEAIPGASVRFLWGRQQRQRSGHLRCRIPDRAHLLRW